MNENNYEDIFSKKEIFLSETDNEKILKKLITEANENFKNENLKDGFEKYEIGKLYKIYNQII